MMSKSCPPACASFPVSPTASVMKSKYIEEAIIFGQANNICTKS